MEKRAANLTAADRQVIVELVEQHAGVIENKKNRPDHKQRERRRMAAGSGTVQRYKTRTPHSTAAKAGNFLDTIMLLFCQVHHSFDSFAV